MSDPVTSQGDRDALIDAMAEWLFDKEMKRRRGMSFDPLPRWGSDSTEEFVRLAWRSEAADLLEGVVLALPDVLLRVLLDTQKPCPEYHHNAFGAEAPCATCDGGSVPLVDREQVLAALGMERVSSRRWNPEWNVWDYWTPEGFEAEGDHRGWEPVFAFRVPVPEPSEGDDR